MNKKVEVNEHLFEVYNKMLVPAFSPHISPNLEKKEVIKKLKETNSFVLRNIKNFDASTKEDFWYIIKDNFIPIEELSKNTRNQVKKGLKLCEVSLVDFDFIKNNCYNIYEKSLLAYNHAPISKELFQSKPKDSQARDYWVVKDLESKTPIAYCSCIKNQESVNYTYIKYHPAYLKLYPSYALHYELDKYYLEHNRVKFVDVGAKSLHHPTNVQTFLIQKFKYRKAFCDLDLIYKPSFKIIVSLLYPFKGIIAKIKKLHKITAVLKQHEIYKLTK